tara:strand:- start:637 stop:2643 length:2007 start_codon:yes stop_codon:yes gene_type:complete
MVGKSIVFQKTTQRRLGALVLCFFVAGCAMEPVPLTPEARTQRSAADLRLIKTMEFVPDGPITLHQAMARAVTFNLQRRVKEIEREIEDAELRTKSFDMLPSLDLDAARSRNSEQLSATDDRVPTTASAGFTWNILDLGVSYARAKQQSDEVLIAREHERKALQDIIRQVRTAYSRAVGAQKLMDGVQAIARHIKVAMRESRAMERSGANDVAKSVSYRREIVESVRQALTLQRELREARTELAELLNIRPGVDFKLASTTLASTMPRLPMSLPEMEKHALENRPELRIEDYNERMSQWQAREALFDMLPGAKLTAGTNYSSDAFNLSPNWISTGFQLGMNLFDLFSGTSKMDEADKRGELARRQRLATTLAVMTQTHMAYIQFRNASQHMRLAREVARADRRLAQLVASDTDFANTDYFEAVRIATRRLQSEADEHSARVELITAHSEMMHAVGLDVFPETVDLKDMDALTDEIRRIAARWETSGDVEPPSDTPLDILVNAMLKGGEAASDRPVRPVPPLPGRRKEPVFEVRLEEPAEEDRISEPEDLPGTLNAIVPASGAAHRKETPPEKPETAAKQAAVLPSSPYHVVQLGVFQSETSAKRLRRDLTEPEDSALHGVEVNIVPRPTKAGRTLHYVETASIPDRAMARELCTILKGTGQDCVSVTR